MAGYVQELVLDTMMKLINPLTGNNKDFADFTRRTMKTVLDGKNADSKERLKLFIRAYITLYATQSNNTKYNSQLMGCFESKFDGALNRNMTDMERLSLISTQIVQIKKGLTATFGNQTTANTPLAHKSPF